VTSIPDEVERVIGSEVECIDRWVFFSNSSKFLNERNSTSSDSIDFESFGSPVDGDEGRELIGNSVTEIKPVGGVREIGIWLRWREMIWR